MKHSIFLVLVFLSILSCKTNEETKADENFTEDDIESIEETSTLNLEESDFEGTYTGKIDGKEIELTLKDDFKFDLKENGKSFSGSYDRLEDGTKIELIADGSKPKFTFYGRSDADHWVKLTNEAEYPDVEQLLTRKEK